MGSGPLPAAAKKLPSAAGGLPPADGGALATGAAESDPSRLRADSKAMSRERLDRRTGSTSTTTGRLSDRRPAIGGVGGHRTTPNPLVTAHDSARDGFAVVPNATLYARH